MDMSQINYLAVIVAALSSFVIGGIWYSPMLFAKGWMTENKFTEESLKGGNQAVMQNTYLKAYEQLPSFKRRSKFSTWLTRIMINECLARLKQSKRTERLPADETDDQPTIAISDLPSPEQALIQKEYTRMLEQAIQSLPFKQRTVFILREMENMSVKETADCMKLSQENIKVLLHRAKYLLRQHLQTRIGDVEPFSFHLYRCDRIVNYVLSHLPQLTAHHRR